MKIFKKTKKIINKINYADKTQSRLFVIISLIAIFTIFTGITYSSFVISKEQNAINIKIADLSYTLSNDKSESTTIKVGANDKKIVNFTLTSKNDIDTKYALNCETNSDDVKVYYSYNQRPNTYGIIGTNGASVSIRIVIDNATSTEQEVSFTISSGYVDNDIYSNIVEGYYEEPLVKRTILLDKDLSNPVEVLSNPDSNGEYLYLDTICTEDATITWNEEKNDIDIETDAKNIACDIYFKKASKQEIELLYLDDTYSDITPIDKDNIDYDKYEYSSSHCNKNVTISYDESTHEISIDDITEKLLCVVKLHERKD